MKKIFVFTLICISTLSSVCFAKSSEQSLDQMVAVVNEDLITRSELERAMTATKMQIAQQPAATNISEKSLEKQVLQQLINKKLQLQTAEQAGISITDQELDKAITNIASQNNVSIDELYKHVEDEGMSIATYRHEIRDQIILQKLQQREIAGKVTITPEEVNAFMKSNAFKENSANEYRLQDILIPTSDTPSTQEIAAVRARAETLMQQLRNGVSFDALAKAESRGATALQGGDLGWRKLPEIPSAFADKITGMKKNDIAGPIQTPNGFHILLMTDLRKLDDNNKTLSDRKAVEAMLLQQKFEAAVQSWVSKLRSQAFITSSLA